ncbi:rho GTPase-activating protein 5-like isoform X3 [Ptychodera flava]|uniref:rho GTPase-activating protein 5-like isoform X3 n=1 Tax=Ptychodera flava TaxID=63121 RepID=UPI00396AA661
MEQTEFIDDTSFQPLRGTNTNSYYKRSTATKLTSAEKLMYICKDQLGLETEYEQKPLPDGKINIDGFLCVFDVSTVHNRTLEQQIKFLDGLFNQLLKTKKPVVLVATKCDEAVDHYRKEADRFATSKKVHMIETSANENVNVETAFMYLAQLIDKRVKAKIVTYHDASKHQKQIIEAATENYNALLQSRVTNYHTLWKTMQKEFEKEKEFERFVEVLGQRRAKLMFQRHIKKLHDDHLTKKLLQYLNTLPKALDDLLPDVNEIAGKQWKECHEMIRKHPNFDKWFVMLEEGENWKESDFIHRDDEIKIPFDVLSRNEPETERGFRDHINRLNARLKKERMKAEFKKLLEETGMISAGKKYEDITVFLLESECYRELNDQEKKEIYDTHQKELGERAKDDFRELMLEYSEVFAKLDPNRTVSKDDLKKIHEALKRETRYSALNFLDQDRDVLLLRHIGFLHNPTKETCLSSENCIDNLVEKCFDSNAHRPSSWNRRTSYIESNDKLNIVLLGKDGLADELANEIRAQSVEEDYTLDGKLYSLELRPIEGDVSLPNHAFRTPQFMPNACICVYSCVPALDYIRTSLYKTVLPSDSSKPEFPGLPLAVIFARETSNSDAENAELRNAGQELADGLQCVFIDIPTDPLWHGKKFHESQITQALRGIIKTIQFRSGLGGENSREYMDPDIKIQLCMMCDDPYPADMVLAPLVNHQCCWINPDKAQTIALDTFLGSEKRKVEVMAVSYHQAMNLKQDLHHGYILAYSTKRKASLSMLRAFSRAVIHVPVLILAVTQSSAILDPESQKLLSDGNTLADELEVKFITASQKFRQETAVFTPFFKEAFDKKGETEHRIKLTRTLSVENLKNEMAKKPPFKPPKPSLRPPRIRDGTSSLKPRHSNTAQDPIDMLYNTVTLGRIRPPKPPRGQASLRHSMKARGPEEDGVWVRNSMPPGSFPTEPAMTGWVDNDVYESVDRKDPPGTAPWQKTKTQPPLPPPLPQLPPTSSFKEGWVKNPVYDSFDVPGQKQEKSSGFVDNILYDESAAPLSAGDKKYPPPVKPKPALKPKPGKLDIAQFDNVNKSLRAGEPSVRHNRAPLATPEDDYALPKDLIKQPLVVAAAGEAVYSEVHDLNKSSKMQKIRTLSKDKPPSDQSSLERPTKGTNEIEYATAAKPQNQRKKPSKSNDKPSPVSDEPPLLPARTDDRLLYGEAGKPGVDSSSDSEDLRQSYKKYDDENPYDAVINSDFPQRVPVLPPLPAKPHQHDIENGESNIDERKNKRSKKEEKEAEKQKKKEEKRLREEEKRKQKEEQKKKKQKGAKGNVSVSYTYFGTPLEEIVNDDDRVPRFVVKCVEYLEAEGLQAEGLYRVPGKNIDSEIILQKFDEDPTVDLAELNVGINAVATALKYFFNELPDPIIPVHLQAEFLEAVGYDDQVRKHEALRSLLDKLPNANFDILEYMMVHLHRITEYSACNLMNSENLSVCWWPTLLHPEFNSFEAMAQNMKMRDVIELFIIDAKYFFAEGEQQEEEQVQ